MESVSVERITVAVYGLAGEGEITMAVEQALLGVPGVSRAYVSPSTEMAYIEYDPAKTTLGQLRGTIEGVGLRTGELNIRSVGAKQPLPTRRRTVAKIEKADPTERGAPAILPGPAAGDLPITARQAPPGASSLDMSPQGQGAPQGHLPGLFPRRLTIFAGSAGLVVLFGALLWFAFLRQGAPENSFSVEVGASGFGPVAVVIPAGEFATLRVHNSDLATARRSGAAHQFVIRELGIDVKLQPGQTTVISLMPLQPATYHYYCDICCGGSGDPAMQGALIVH